MCSYHHPSTFNCSLSVRFFHCLQIRSGQRIQQRKRASRSPLPQSLFPSYSHPSCPGQTLKSTFSSQWPPRRLHTHSLHVLKTMPAVPILRPHYQRSATHTISKSNCSFHFARSLKHSTQLITLSLKLSLPLICHGPSWASPSVLAGSSPWSWVWKRLGLITLSPFSTHARSRGRSHPHSYTSPSAVRTNPRATRADCV